jgi:hypothetical protein
MPRRLTTARSGELSRQESGREKSVARTLVAATAPIPRFADG